MKTYKINNVEISVEELRKVIKDNPEILKEEKSTCPYFFPKKGEGEAYYYITDATCVFVEHQCVIDRYVNMGVYRTKEEAEKARDKQLAKVRLWKWASENVPFVPDWGNGYERKYFVFFDHAGSALRSNSNSISQLQFDLPYFKSEEDAERFIKECEKDLLTYMGIEK